MAGDFGDPDSVRRLGQALKQAGGGLNSAASDLSGQVKELVPAGWSGDDADKFCSDWAAKTRQARQLAAVCTHVGGVLTDLAAGLDAAGAQATRAQQMTGGPASRFALPSTEQKSRQMLSQASGDAQQARAAAGGKLRGIVVPKIGAPLTASQVNAWAQRLAPPPGNWLDHALHDLGGIFSSLFGGGHNNASKPSAPLSNTDSFVQVSPHVWVPANDPKLPDLKAAWAWASKRPVYLSGSSGDTEFTRWHMIFTVSPWAQDLNKGQPSHEFGSFQPDFRIEGAFNQNQNVLLSTAGMGAVVFLGDPKSLVGLSVKALRKLIARSGWRAGEPGEPLQNADQAQIPPEKFWNYSMDPTNPASGAKWKDGTWSGGKPAAWKRLGYDVDTVQGRQAATGDVMQQLQQAMAQEPAQFNRVTSYGKVFETRTLIQGPNGQEGTLVCDWQYDNGSSVPKLTTDHVEISKPGVADQTVSDSFTDDKGTTIRFKAGDPSAKDPLQRGSYLEYEAPNGTVTDIAIKGNPVLDDPGAPNLSVTTRDGSTREINTEPGTDDPGDGTIEDGGVEGIGGDAGGGGDAAGGE